MGFVLNLFNKYGLIMLFVLVCLEYACFPIPSEIVLPFMGFVTKLNDYSLVGVFILSVISGYVGSLICYVIGWYGGSYLCNKIYFKYTKIQKGLELAKDNFDKRGNISVFVCRLIPLCRTYISFLSGTFKQGVFNYSIYTILGILIWNVILISLGYFLADNWGLVVDYYQKYKCFLLVLILFIIFFLLYKRIKKRKNY